jgi:hypothetical protein
MALAKEKLQDQERGGKVEGDEDGAGKAKGCGHCRWRRETQWSCGRGLKIIAQDRQLDAVWCCLLFFIYEILCPALVYPFLKVACPMKMYSIFKSAPFSQRCMLASCSDET